MTKIMGNLVKVFNFFSEERECEERITSFDMLRIVALVGVLIQHTYAYIAIKFGVQEWMHGIQLGRFGVSLFVILSGASIALKGFKNGGYFSFVRRRASSILPFYWTAYVVVGVFLFLFFGIICMRDDVLKILLTLFALDGYMSSQVKTYYLIGEWFTGFILIMYLLAPLVHWSIRKTRGAALPLYFVISALAIKYTPVLSKSIVIWNTHGNYNVLSRIMEFALGMFFSLYVLRRRRLHAAFVGAGSVYIAVFCAMGHDVLEFTASGFLSVFCIFLIFTYALSYVPFAESQRKIISFFSKYSFMAFLFHHQVLLVIKQKLVLQCTPNFFVFMLVSVFVVSYILAYLFYGPAQALKTAVFGPYHERK